MDAFAARPDSEDTQGLLARAGSGEAVAADELFARQRTELRAFVELHLDPRLRARVDPSDVVQEAQAVMAQRLPDFLTRRPMPFHLWGRKTAYERLLNVHRDHRASRRDVAREARSPDLSSLALAHSFVAAGPTPSEVASAREVAARVATAIEELADEDREILLMKHAEGLSYEEIACLLEITAAAARKRYGRALIRLQSTLSRHGILESES
jgi:RNA polymerase sigma-70 factor (ECF subfamily)